MRLTELEPRWATTSKGGGRAGVTFLCPHCKEQRLAVFFSNPLDGAPPHDGRTWQRSGESFEDMTLSPSVDASASGHWHGFITSGNIT